MMVIERFYFSTGGHIKAIFLKKTLDKSLKIEGFALKMIASTYYCFSHLNAVT